MCMRYCRHHRRSLCMCEGKLVILLLYVCSQEFSLTLCIIDNTHFSNCHQLFLFFLSFFSFFHGANICPTFLYWHLLVPTVLLVYMYTKKSRCFFVSVCV